MSRQDYCRQHSYYESSARERVLGLVDKGSFQEYLGPTHRNQSPHLIDLGHPSSFDDGIVVGEGCLKGRIVLVAAQEGGFMGGAVGEIHGAKLVGVLERAIVSKPAGVLLLLDSGGVRLHEANAGLIAISEIIRSLLATRATGIPVIALIGGANGCFGGMGIVASCCDQIIMSEEGRLALSGPEVIETVRGVEEFDSRDRSLVWRTTGGKHRYLIGECDALVADSLPEFRNAACLAIEQECRSEELETLAAHQVALKSRLAEYGDCPDGIDIWHKQGIANPEQLPALEVEEFLKLVENRGMS